MKKITHLLIIVAFVFASNSTYAQYRTYQEIGGSIGPSLINGDWGNDSNAAALLSPTGVEANFIYNIQFVRSRVNISNNLGVSYTTHSHKGAPNDSWGFDDPKTKNQFENMKGSSTIVTLGSMLRLDFRDFGLYYPRNTWTPYIGGGFNLMYYMPNVTRDDESIPFPAYLDTNNDGTYAGIIDDGGFTASLKASIGAKFKITRFIYFYGEFMVQRSFSAKIDGIDSKSSTSPDYINGINLGIVYTIW